MLPSVGTGPPIVLLVLEHAGREWYHSAHPVDVLDGTRSLHFRGGMAGIDLFVEAVIGGVSPQQSYPIEIAPQADLEALVAQGHLLWEMRAEVSLWRSGASWDDRQVWLSGSAEVREGGQLGRVLRLQVTADDPAAQPGTWPNPEARMNEDTWGAVTVNNRRAAEDGSVYPTIVGQPGHILDADGSPAAIGACPVLPVMLDTAVSPVYRFEYQSPWGDCRVANGGWWTEPGAGNLLGYGIIHQGWLYPGPVGHASRGTIQGFYRQTGTATWTTVACTIVYARDQLGQLVTLVDGLVAINGVPPIPEIRDNYEYAVAIPPPCVGGAGRTYQSGFSTAGEIVEWALLQSSVRVDWRRTGAALPGLRMPLGGFWDRSCSEWDWCVDNVLPLLPASWIPGPRGVYPVVWRLDTTAEQADLELVDGLNCTIEGEIEEDGGDDLLTRITLDSARAIVDGIWRRRHVWSGAQTRHLTREYTSLHSRIAQQRWGSTRGARMLALERVIESDLIYRDDAAIQYLAMLIRLHCQPTRTVRVLAPWYSILNRAEPAMTASITSTRHASLASPRVAHVARAGWLGGACYADLLILPEP